MQISNINCVAVLLVMLASQFIISLPVNTKAIAQTSTENANRFDEKYTSAQAGDAQAQFEVGVYLVATEGVDPDYKTLGLEFLSSAASQGTLDAQLFLGSIYEVGELVSPDPFLSTKFYNMAANQGDAFAQSRMGFAYFNGTGVPEDLSQAREWHSLAANAGNASSQTALGSIYRQGNGVPKNYREAFKWMHAAAVQGDPNAQYLLGWTYFMGEGVSKSLVQAYKWFSLAALQKVGQTETILLDLEQLMTSNEIAEAQSLASRCFHLDYRDCD